MKRIIGVTVAALPTAVASRCPLLASTQAQAAMSAPVTGATISLQRHLALPWS